MRIGTLALIEIAGAGASRCSTQATPANIAPIYTKTRGT